MPHCIIEYTKELDEKIDFKELMNIAFESVDETGLFNRSAIKARVKPYDMYRSGLDRDDYIHVQIRILPGRTDEQKKLLTETVLKNITPLVGKTKSTSVEVVDMHGPSYGKRIVED